jgi:hypothetical protein
MFFNPKTILSVIIVSDMTLQMVMDVYTLMEQVWISPTSTLGKPMYWTGAGDGSCWKDNRCIWYSISILTIF